MSASSGSVSLATKDPERDRLTPRAKRDSDARTPCVVRYANSALLAGIKNVRQLGKKTRTLSTNAQVDYTRCTFEMDGPALAHYMRDKLEQVLRDKGKLSVLG